MVTELKLAFLTCNKTEEIAACISILSPYFERMNADVIVKDAIDLLPPQSSESFIRFFAQYAIQARRPFSFLNAYDSFSIKNKAKFPVYSANRLYIQQLRSYLEEEKIDVVICFQVYQVQAVSFIKEKYGNNVKLAMVVPNYECPKWIEETNPDTIFVPHEDYLIQLTQRGCNPDKIVLSGIPVADKFHYSVSKEDARNSLDLPVDVPCFLVSNGGDGFGDDPIFLIRKIIERAKGIDMRIVVMTGRNSALADSIRSRFTADPRVSPVPFSDQYTKYMDACDVLMIRPDPYLMTEAAIKGIPFVCSAPNTEQETKALSFFAGHDLCTMPLSFENTIDEVIELAKNEKLHDERFLALRRNIPHKAADKICSAVREMMQTADHIIG